MTSSGDNRECICGHLEEFHDENGWCCQASCVCSYFDSEDEFDEGDDD